MGKNLSKLYNVYYTPMQLTNYKLKPKIILSFMKNDKTIKKHFPTKTTNTFFRQNHKTQFLAKIAIFS
ncbi:unnamed protein product [Brassica oleracea]